MVTRNPCRAQDPVLIRPRKTQDLLGCKVADLGADGCLTRGLIDPLERNAEPRVIDFVGESDREFAGRLGGMFFERFYRGNAACQEQLAELCLGPMVLRAADVGLEKVRHRQQCGADEGD